MSDPNDAGPAILGEAPAGVSDSPEASGQKPAIPGTLPILPLKNTVVFPGIPTPLVVGRPASILLIDEAMVRGRIIGLVAQNDPGVEAPGEEHLYRVGTAAVIQRLLKFPDGTIRILVNGLQRITIRRLLRSEPYLVAEIEPLEE